MSEWILQPRKFDDILDQVLYNRGIILKENDDTKFDFLKPDFAKLHDPFLMKNLKKAVERIQKAKENDEVVGIFADYDADGIPGAALLYEALTQLKIKSHVFIPNREGGYGLSKDGINYLVSKKCSLIITVDLGIRNFAEAEYCKEIGVDLIITDHHTPDDKIPKANLVINPKIKGDKYPYKELCGCGVAYKLICGLSKIYPKELSEAFLKWNLDLVAISTISDVVPLTGENRILASFGLMVLRKTKNLGLRNLYEVAKIDPKNINAYHVGFQIGPRINAPGRMDHATKSFELLTTDDEKEARKLANWLEEKNQSRQDAMDKTEKEAISEIEKSSLFKNNILIVSGDWLKGVIGPTASRLVEKFNRPVIMLAADDDSFAGSARSVAGVNILDLVENSGDFLEKFGGHKGACGLTVSKNKFKKFTSSIIEYANKIIKPEDLTKKIKIDAEILPQEISLRLYNNLKKLEPYGMGNPKPVFEISDIEVKYLRPVGADGKHLSFHIKKDDNEFKVIYFNGGLVDEKIDSMKKYDIVFSLDLDTWQGRNDLKLNILDMKKT